MYALLYCFHTCKLTDCVCMSLKYTVCILFYTLHALTLSLYIIAMCESMHTHTYRHSVLVYGYQAEPLISFQSDT